MWLLGCLASSCSQDLRSMLRKILWTRNTLSRGNPPSGTWEIAIAHGRISILTKALFNMKRTLFVTWDSQLLGITFLSTTETPHQPTTGTATPLCCVYLSSNYLCLLWVHWVHCQMQKKKHGHKVNQSLLRTGRSFMRDMLASLWYKKKSFIHGSLLVASILQCCYSFLLASCLWWWEMSVRKAELPSTQNQNTWHLANPGADKQSLQLWKRHDGKISACQVNMTWLSTFNWGNCLSFWDW